jgi:protein-disulfide isomerase
MTREAPTLKPLVGEHDHSQGDADAKLVLVEYGDYECPHCARAYPIVKHVQQHFGTSLRFVFRNFPLAQAHPHATHAAWMAEAAALQGQFWPMHDLLFENQDRLRDADLIDYAHRLQLDMPAVRAAFESDGVAERVRRDFSSGVRSGVNGTPTFFVNGSRFDGDWSRPREFAQELEGFIA